MLKPGEGFNEGDLEGFGIEGEGENNEELNELKEEDSSDDFGSLDEIE